MFKFLRIIVLCIVLLFAFLGVYTTQSKHANWDNTKWVVVYPVNADGSQQTAAYIEHLRDYHFESVAAFFAREAERFQLPNDEPVKILLGPVIDALPPEPPRGGNIFQVAWWSLKTKFWASDIKEEYDAPPHDVAVFAKYYDPQTYATLPHSYGIAKFSLGIVNGFADRGMTESNNVVIAHELLHVFAATDKYNTGNDMPLYPDGFAEPHKSPRYPQDLAEIMGGRIPVSESQADMPDSLKQVVMGDKTAEEINWRVR